MTPLYSGAEVDRLIASDRDRHPFLIEPPGEIPRAGDLALRREDGQAVLLGHIDESVVIDRDVAGQRECHRIAGHPADRPAERAVLPEGLEAVVPVVGVVDARRPASTATPPVSLSCPSARAMARRSSADGALRDRTLDIVPDEVRDEHAPVRPDRDVERVEELPIVGSEPAHGLMKVPGAIEPLDAVIDRVRDVDSPRRALPRLPPIVDVGPGSPAGSRTGRRRRLARPSGERCRRRGRARRSRRCPR